MDVCVTSGDGTRGCLESQAMAQEGGTLSVAAPSILAKKGMFQTTHLYHSSYLARIIITNPKPQRCRAHLRNVL